MRKLKNNMKGITLVALVVTIIVLLILAGATISILLGENGLITKTIDTMQKTEIASIKEKIKLAHLASFDENGQFNGDLFLDNLNNTNGMTAMATTTNGEITYPVTIATEKKMYEMDSDINLKELVPGLYYAGTDEMILTWDELFDENIGNMMLNPDRRNNGELYRANFDLSKVKDKNETIVSTTGRNVKLIVDKSITSVSSMGGLTQLEEIILPPTITNINGGSFGSCSNLKSVVIPSGDIGGGVFYNSSNLEKVMLGNKVTSIGDNVFYATKIKECIMPNSVKTLGTNMFSGCSELENIVISDNVESISPNTLGHPENLKSINLGNGITEIPSNCFSSYQKLEKVKLGNKVTKVGASAFYYCINLKDINLPDTITEIETFSFVDCKSLVNIKLPQSLTSLGSQAFMRCTNLKTIEIPNGVAKVCSYTFQNCTSLESIIIPGSITLIENCTFEIYQGKLKDVYYKGTEEQWNEIEIGVSNSALLNATIHFNS